MRDTQIQAWASLQTTVSKKRFTVLKTINDSGGLALFEVAQKLDLPFHHISGRITELFEQGLVKDTGLRRTNPKTKKEQIVWHWSGLDIPRKLTKQTAQEIIADLKEQIKDLQEEIALLKGDENGKV